MGRTVVFGNQADHDSGGKSCNDGEKDIQRCIRHAISRPAFRQKRRDDEIAQNSHDERGTEFTGIQASLGISAFFYPDEERADD